MFVTELTTPTQSDKCQKLFFWDAPIRQLLRVYSTILSRAWVNVSGWPSGLRRQTQASASHLWGFWSPNGGVGSNPTSDTSSFCSYDIQNKSVGKFLILNSGHSNISGPWQWEFPGQRILEYFQNHVEATSCTAFWDSPPPRKKRTITTCGLFLSGSTDESSTVGCWVFTVERMNEILTAFLYTEKNLL